MPDFPSNVSQTPYMPGVVTTGVDGQNKVGGTEPGKEDFVMLDPKGNLGSGNTQGNNFMTSRMQSPGTPGGNDVSSTKEALGKFDSQTLGFDIYSVMALFQKLAQTQRDTSRELRQANLQAQVSSLQGAAQDMRKAAEERMVGAIVAGSMQLAGGLVSIGSGVMSGMQALKAGKSLDESNKLTPEGLDPKSKGKMGDSEIEMVDLSKKGTTGTTDSLGGTTLDSEVGKLDKMQSQATQLKQDFEVQMHKAQVTQMVGKGVSESMGGIGGIVHATQDRKGAELDAAAKDKETQAKVFESNVQQSNDLMQQTLDMIRDVRDKLGSIEQSSTETNRGIARNI